MAAFGTYSSQKLKHTRQAHVHESISTIFVENERMMRCILLPICFLILISGPLSAQANSCTGGGKTIRELRQMAAPKNYNALLFSKFEFSKPISFAISVLHTPAASALPASSVFLPRWYAADLPVFCRIEHEMGKKLPVPVKFRLGSVEYVDWLEGK